MRFTISRKTLLSMLVSAGKVINPRSPMPILTHYKVSLRGGSLSVTGSDVENVVTLTAEVAGGDGDGVFCVESRRMLQLIKSMPDCDCSFGVDLASLSGTVRYQRGSFRFAVQNGAEYPADMMPEGSALLETALPAKDFLAGLRNVGFAKCADELRPAMKGVYVNFLGDSVDFVATDTRFLACYTVSGLTESATGSFILPAKAVDTLPAFIRDDDESVKIVLRSQDVTVQGDNVTFSTRLVKGTYPDYRRVIPKNNTNIAVVSRDELLNAVKRMAVCAPQESNSAVACRFTGDTLKLSAEDPATAFSVAEDTPCAYEGMELEIGLQGQRLAQLLEAVNCDKAALKMADPSRPLIIVPMVQEENTEHTLICMPMNIR